MEGGNHLFIFTVKNVKKKLAMLAILIGICFIFFFGMPFVYQSLVANREDDYRELGEPIRADRNNNQAAWFQILLNQSK